MVSPKVDGLGDRPEVQAVDRAGRRDLEATPQPHELVRQPERRDQLPQRLDLGRARGIQRLQQIPRCRDRKESVDGRVGREC